MNVALIGDSIRAYYEPYVQAAWPQATILEVPKNSGDSAMLLANCGGWFPAVQPDVVHFNCGLHDLRYWTPKQAYQVPVEEYQRNLTALVERLQGDTTAKLIWATITPVIEERHNDTREYHRFNADVDAYNAAARAVMAAAGVAVNDLHAFVLRHDPDVLIKNDGVHFTPEGEQLLGEEVARVLRATLGERSE